MLQEGKHKVLEITDCFFGISEEKGTPFFALTLKTETESIDWICYLHNNFTDPRSKQMAIKNMENLVKAGFVGKSLSDMASGNVSELFEKTDETMTVTVEHEEYEGRQIARAKYFNVGKNYNKVDKSTAQISIKNLPYDGWLLTAKNLSKKVVNKNNYSGEIKAEDTVSEIPF